LEQVVVGGRKEVGVVSQGEGMDIMAENMDSFGLVGWQAKGQVKMVLM
jgi:hypothetical protein